MARPRAARSEEERKERLRAQKREWARKRRERAYAAERSEALAEQEVVAQIRRQRQQSQQWHRRRRANATADDRAKEAKRKREARLRQRATPLGHFPGATARCRREFIENSFGAASAVCDRLCLARDVTTIGGVTDENQQVTGALRQCLASSADVYREPDKKKEPAACCTHGISTKPVQTEASWPFNSSVDVAVETSRSVDVCKSTQTSLVVVKVHRWTETTDLVESQDSDTDVRESPALQVYGMPRLTNMDQSPGVAILYSHQVDGQCDGTFVDCSKSLSAAQTLYDGSCIVRWCTNISRGRLFRVPKDNRMEAFLKYAERPHLLGLPKEIVHHYRICSEHFTESDYMDPAKTKLKWLAVPSIKAPDESEAPQVYGMSRLTNMDQSPGVAALYSHQVDRQSDGSSVDCSSGADAVRLPYFGSCIVRWCTNTSPGRLFRVPKDNRMEAFLKYAERPYLLGLPKEIVHHYRICSEHFTESDYMDPAKTKLKWLAVPSIEAPDESEGDAASPGHLREPSPQPGPSGL